MGLTQRELEITREVDNECKRTMKEFTLKILKVYENGILFFSLNPLKVLVKKTQKSVLKTIEIDENEKEENESLYSGNRFSYFFVRF